MKREEERGFSLNFFRILWDFFVSLPANSGRINGKKEEKTRKSRWVGDYGGGLAHTQMIRSCWGTSTAGSHGNSSRSYQIKLCLSKFAIYGS